MNSLETLKERKTDKIKRTRSVDENKDYPSKVLSTGVYFKISGKNYQAYQDKQQG